MLRLLKVTVIWAASIWLAQIAGGGQAWAQSAPAFYKGKTVKFIVGSGVGGGYDAYARMLAPHLAKVLDATVVVQNQPGAAGTAALNRMYAAAGDGLQLMLANGTYLVMVQLLEDEAVKFDFTKLGHLGLVASSPWMWVAAPHHPFNTPAEFLKSEKKINWAVDGLGDTVIIPCYALRMNCKIIKGYPGSSSFALAMAQGEVDSLYISDTSSSQYVAAGSAKPVAAMSPMRSKLFPNIPTVYELVTLDADQKWWMDFRASLDDLGRILVVPPDVPKDQLAFLQEAAAKVLNDPAVIAEGAATQREISYQSAEIVRSKIDAVLTHITADQRRKVKDLVFSNQ